MSIRLNKPDIYGSKKPKQLYFLECVTKKSAIWYFCFIAHLIVAINILRSYEKYKKDI